MPHQCVHCSEVFEDGSEEVLKGCSKCGSRFFFYITSEKLERIRNNLEKEIELSTSEKKQIERDVREIVGKDEEDAPIVLDFESIKILKPGKYLIDIHNLFSKKRPLIYKLEDGKYIVDLTSLATKNQP